MSFFVWLVFSFDHFFCGVLFFGVLDMKKRHDRRAVIAYGFHHTLLTHVRSHVRSLNGKLPREGGFLCDGICFVIVFVLGLSCCLVWKHAKEVVLSHVFLGVVTIHVREDVGEKRKGNELRLSIVF